MQLDDVLEFVHDVLHRGEIQYVIVGGVAVGAAGYMRGTRDVDVIVLVEPDKVDSLLSLIEAAGLTISRRASVLEKLKKGLPAKIIWDQVYSFDLRLAMYGADVNALNRRYEARVGDQTFFVATPEDLIVYKLARFAGIDQQDIRMLIRLHRNLNWPYIERTAIEFSDQAVIPQMKERLAIAERWFRKRR